MRSPFLSLKANVPREEGSGLGRWSREITSGVSWRMAGELEKKVRKAKVNLNSDPEALLE